MSEINLIRSYFQTIRATEICIAENLIIPALILIYSSIDSTSWLASDDDNQPVAKRFQSWVDNWMLKKFNLPCTAIELYAARCGILHTLTPTANLNDKKGIRQISYAWGTTKQEDLDKTIKLIDNQQYVAVHINDIFFSFRNGLYEYLEEIEKDAIRKNSFAQKASKHFANLDPFLMGDLLSSSRDNFNENH